ncbi:hypothetical protein PAXRUDRAFT_829149 [Paxillus rubicundulus Ve08.2h10]|uniref:Uncharacterized protein n=1 Tax=Paxillus rubicundulus Ve08.2h10 TaxID=930991 RepID=A0A0D0E6C6_9AGAM|nr:hypothetical protein PAXRUDRAFT_829149 [Paxillus rubicundulus Ve08.2h10]
MQLFQTLAILACAAYAAATCGECPTEIDNWTLSSSCSSPNDESLTVCTYSDGPGGNRAPGFCRYVDGNLVLSFGVACPPDIIYDGSDCPVC